MTDTALPPLALSVRQPWAWAIIHAGKDVENRTPFAIRHMPQVRGQIDIAIHASKGMTRSEYESARDFMERINVRCPNACDLLRGGIIGIAETNGTSNKSASRWFFGPSAIFLQNQRPVEFIGSTGALGLFKWTPNDQLPEAPAKWMLGERRTVRRKEVSDTSMPLFDRPGKD